MDSDLNYIIDQINKLFILSKKLSADELILIGYYSSSLYVESVVENRLRKEFNTSLYTDKYLQLTAGLSLDYNGLIFLSNAYNNFNISTRVAALRRIVDKKDYFDDTLEEGLLKPSFIFNTVKTDPDYKPLLDAFEVEYGPLED